MRKKLSDLFNRYFVFFTLAPGLTLLFAIVVYPSVYLLISSFFNLEVTTLVAPEFVWFKNYIDIFKDAMFWKTFGKSLIYVFSTTPLSFVTGLVLALVLNQLNRGKKFFTTIFLIPWVIPPSVSGVIWKWIYNDSWGILNDILIKLSIINQPLNWLGESFSAMLGLIVTDSWTRIPFAMIILLASLQSIPDELYEAARIDGANIVQSFWHITFQLLRPSIFMVVLLTITFSFRTYSLIYTLTGGGPGIATNTLAMYIYDNGIKYLKISYSSALAVVMILIILIITYINKRIINPSDNK